MPGYCRFAFGVVIGAAANFLVQIPALRRLACAIPLSLFQTSRSTENHLTFITHYLMYTLNQFQVIVNSILDLHLFPAASQLFGIPTGYSNFR
jgi:putative peptidoglycan lipid II flippase